DGREDSAGARRKHRGTADQAVDAIIPLVAAIMGGTDMPLDLLVFGPHPDDIEIGLGGTVARHTAAGHSVGLCDLTEGEMGSNGTPEERRAEAVDAARVLGARWRENLRWPDGGITASPEMIRSAVDLIRRHQPRTIAVPYWEDRHPDHVAASEVLRLAAF